MSDNNQQEQKYAFQIDDDGSVIPRALVRGNSVPEVPPGVYTLVFVPPTPMSGFKIYLRPENNFKLPTRLYGNINLNVDRFLKSYEMNDKNLGTLFVGEQGSGKTLLLKALSVKAVQMGFPVILVDEKIPGEILNWFLTTMVQNTLVCFDEFEKLYNKIEEQTAILRLLDGTNTGTKKMYCFTANRIEDVSPHLLNRPSRIRYVMTFRRLEVATVVDYVQQNLKNCDETHLRAFIHMALCDGVTEHDGESNGMNFDSMCEYVREMNQFGGTLNETLDIMGMNGKKSFSRFDVNGFVNGAHVHQAVASGIHRGAYAATDGWDITFSIQVRGLVEKLKPEDPDRYEWNSKSITLTSDDFKGFGDSYNSLVFEQDGVEYHLRYLEWQESRKLARKVVEQNNLGKSKGRVPVAGLPINALEWPQETELTSAPPSNQTPETSATAGSPSTSPAPFAQVFSQTVELRQQAKEHMQAKPGFGLPPDHPTPRD